MSNYFDYLNDIVQINMLQKGLDSLSDWSRMALKIEYLNARICTSDDLTKVFLMLPGI